MKNKHTKNLDSTLQAELIKAAKAGNIMEMHRLILKGADPFVSEEGGYNAVLYAASSNPESLHYIIPSSARSLYKKDQEVKDEK